MATACVDDTENRQFASDPRTPQPTPTSAPVEILEATPITVGRPVASPETLVDRRGAPETAYLHAAGALWAVQPDGLEQVAEGPLLDFTASPSGHQVAVAVAVDSALDVMVFALDGALEQQYDRVLELPETAAPSADSGYTNPVSLSWAPSGARLLVSHVSGQLVDIRLDGDIDTIETATSIEGVEHARWSPRGDQIGAVIRNEAGYGRLALIKPSGDGAARVNVIAPVGSVAGEPASVEEFGWKPYGDGVLFLQGNRADGGVRNGQIVSWDQASNTTQVMATGGQAGPTGSVREFSVGPDGKAFAYVIDIPTSDGHDFGGLYVRSLTHGQLYRVPVAPNVTVGTFWWLGDGLAWTAQPTGEDTPTTISVRWIDASGVRNTAGEIQAVPAATPVVVTPVASPVGSPAASPVASPVASSVDDATPIDATSTG